MRFCRAAMIGCLLSALTGCTATPSGEATTGPAYSCCQAADINRDYQPGQTLTVHWILVPRPAGNDHPVRQVELNARLTGPWTTVSDLKAAATTDGAPTGRFVFTAEPLSASGLAGEQPVSRIAISPVASPGYYELDTSVSEPGGTASGGSIIRVIPKT